MTAQSRVARALAASAVRYGLSIAVDAVDERPWASATFVGARLTVALTVTGKDAARWLAALPEEDLPIPNRLIADCVVLTFDADRATIELLLLET